MQLQDSEKLQQPPGHPISLAGSRNGHFYAGWSSGAIMSLSRDSSTLQVYVKGCLSPNSTVQHRTPRSKFQFANPIAIDAWSAFYFQYVGDDSLNCVFEVSDDFVTVVAGTGALGRKDGDGLTQATFESIRSITVLPKYIAVLSKYECNGAIRLIDRTTHRVTTLDESPKDALQLLNGSQSAPTLDAVYLATIWPTTYILSTKRGKVLNSSNILIFRSATKTIEIVRNRQRQLELVSSLDNRQMTPQALEMGSFLPVYCPLSDSLFNVKKGSLHRFRNFFARKEDSVPFAIEFNVTTLLNPSGLKHDLEITHDASNTTFRLFRSVIDRNLCGQTIIASSRLALFVTSSKLPVATITRFIEHLYFKPLTGTDLQQLIALAWTSKEVFGQEDPIIIKALQDSIKTEPDAAVFDLLISSWTNVFGPFQLDETSLIVATMLPKAQQKRHDFKLAIEASMISQASNLDAVLSRMMSLFMLVAGPPLVARFHHAKSLDASLLAPTIVGSDASFFLSRCSTNFVIQLGLSISIGVCGWLLYVHWPWFKRLVDSSIQESKTRIITLPSNSFEASALSSVLTMLQFGQRNSSHPVSTQDAISILEHAPDYGLVDVNGKPLPRIAPLIKYCEAKGMAKAKQMASSELTNAYGSQDDQCFKNSDTTSAKMRINPASFSKSSPESSAPSTTPPAKYFLRSFSNSSGVEEELRMVDKLPDVPQNRELSHAVHLQGGASGSVVSRDR